MRRLLTIWFLAIGTSGPVAGCGVVGYHHPPKPGRPAATVKFRIRMERPTGLLLVPVGALFRGLRPRPRPRASLRIDGRYLRGLGRGLRAGRTVAAWTRVRPGWRTFAFRAWWEVRYSAWENKTVYVYKTARCRKYKCRSSYGVAGHGLKCGMVNEICTKRVRETRRRLVTHVVRRGVCETRARFWMRKDGTYLLIFVSLGRDHCRLTCHEQVFAPEGGFRLLPCPRARR